MRLFARRPRPGLRSITCMAVLALTLTGTARHVLAQADAPEAPAPPPTADAQPSASSSAPEKTPPQPLYELMFEGYERHQPGWYDTFVKVFNSGAMMTNDRAVAVQRLATITESCTEMAEILSQVSPKTSEYGGRAKTKDLRRRVIFCQMASSEDLSLRKGNFDTVGEFALVREEPHGEYHGAGIQGTDLDILKVYVFLDKACKDGAVPSDFLPHLVHDVGGYLFANVEYFVNTDANHEVKKADTKAVKKTAHDLMASIADAIAAEKAPHLVTLHKGSFEEWAKKD